MIEVANLSKRYGKVEAVAGVSFHVGAGEVYGLLGPNGAGKSTAIGVISGLLRPSAGQVEVGGHDIVGSPEAAKRILGVVPQQSVVIEELSALQNCSFFGSLYGLGGAALRARSRELIDWIGLGEKAGQPAGEFSGGQMRRLTLVLALLHEPRALVLDEPTVGLDPQTRLRIHEAIREVARAGAAVLMSTHYLDEAEQLCDRIGIIDHGRIIREGTLAELRASVQDVQLLSLRGGFDRASLSALVGTIDGARVLHEDEHGVTVSLPSRTSELASILERAASLERVAEVSVKPPSLESLFISLTGRALRE